MMLEENIHTQRGRERTRESRPELEHRPADHSDPTVKTTGVLLEPTIAMNEIRSRITSRISTVPAAPSSPLKPGDSRFQS